MQTFRKTVLSRLYSSEFYGCHADLYYFLRLSNFFDVCFYLDICLKSLHRTVLKVRKPSSNLKQQWRVPAWYFT